MNCNYSKQTLECSACGHVAQSPPTFRACTGAQVRLPRIAIGDIAEAALAAVGITPGVAQAITGQEDCGCAGRKGRMNQWGFQQQERAEAALNAAATFLLGGG